MFQKRARVDSFPVFVYIQLDILFVGLRGAKGTSLSTFPKLGMGVFAKPGPRLLCSYGGGGLFNFLS